MGNLDLLKWNQYDRLWGLSDEVFSMGLFTLNFDMI